MARASTARTLADLAEGQWGLFTRRQAEATGMAWTTLNRMIRTGFAERVAHGVYRIRGVPVDDRLELHAAWLQLAPDVPAWERNMDQGVLSHRSAAAIYGLGHLAADVHHFTLPARKQTRREDVRLHRAKLGRGDIIKHAGLLVTRPARIAADLISDREAPDDVAQVIGDALRVSADDPVATARAIAPLASRMGLAEGDGAGLLEWLLDLTQDPQRASWVAQARQRDS